MAIDPARPKLTNPQVYLIRMGLFLVFIAFLLVILATWFAASEAHKLRGWRTLLLPVVVLLIALASAFILNILINSTQITLDSLMGAFGLQPR